MTRVVHAALFILGICLSAFSCGDGSDSNFMRDTLNLGGFCGRSTEAECSSDGKCFAGGCSGQLCQGIREMIGTTCEWLDCYRDEDYVVKCGCVEGRCQWYKEVPKSD